VDHEPNPTLVDLFFFWPRMMMAAWSGFARLAPQTLVQPILPGWAVGNVYNVTENNSTAPQTEQEIVSRHSYGRQLGRMSDALSVLVAQRLEAGGLSASDAKRLGDFTDLVRSIEEIKSRATLKRVERLATELSRLKAREPELYDRALTILEATLRR
jgi:hypothetical protein